MEPRGPGRPTSARGARKTSRPTSASPAGPRTHRGTPSPGTAPAIRPGSGRFREPSPGPLSGPLPNGSRTIGAPGNAKEGQNPGHAEDWNRTIDISAVNEKLHNWSRFDTFQTPSGRVEENHSPAAAPMTGPEAEMMNQASCTLALAREMDAFRKDMTRCMRDVRMELSASRKTHDKTTEAVLAAVEITKSEMLDAIKQDRQRIMGGLERIVKDSKSDDLEAIVEMIKESMLASCSHIVAATKDRASNDLGAAISVLQESRAADMSQVVREVRDSKREDLTLFMKAVRDDVSNVCEALKAGQSQDFKMITQAIKESEKRVESKIESSEAVVNALQRSMTSDSYITAVREEIHKVKTKVDFTPIIKAVEDIKLNVDMRPVVQAIHESRSEVLIGPVLKAISEQKPPEVDLAPVLSAIQDIGIVVDFAPILDAIHDMKESGGPGLSEADLRSIAAAAREQVDAGPLLDAMRDMRTEVDFTPAFETIRFAVKEAMHESHQPRLDFGVGGVDLAPVLAAIHDLKTRYGEIAPVLQAIKLEVGQESSRKSDLASVHDRVLQEVSTAVKACEATVKECADKQKAEAGAEAPSLLEPVLAAIAEKREVDLSPLLLAIRETRSEIDLTMIKSGVSEQVSAAVEEVRTRVSRETGQLSSKLDDLLQEVQQLAFTRSPKPPMLEAAPGGSSPSTRRPFAGLAEAQPPARKFLELPTEGIQQLSESPARSMFMTAPAAPTWPNTIQETV